MILHRLHTGVRRRVAVRLSVLIVALMVAVIGAPATNAAPPTGFSEEVVFSGLTNPMNIQFAADGRVFVAEKSGLIKVYDSLTDTTPTEFADLRTKVHNFWDRGLLGMALPPGFPTTSPYVYVLYAHDALIGGTAPRWGIPNTTSDSCPNPPGATTDGCVISGRLSRLQAAGNVVTGTEQVLVEDWCAQYPSHTVGTIAFGSDGALYVSGGDGASFTFTDYGQGGGSAGSPTPRNPCGDPPGGSGSVLSPPTAEGGALRAQDLRTSGDPVGLDGTVLRLDPATGAAMPNNPLAGSADPNARRIIAQGLRNPFRFAIRPGTSEVWLGDVGWTTWEEINRIPDPTDAIVENFGWPCYEGTERQPGYDAANLNICETLYGQAGAVTAPYFSYRHDAVVGGGCRSGSSSLSGMAFYPTTGGVYPSTYAGALFFADYSRDCIYVMRRGTNGLPDPANVSAFVVDALNPVDLKVGPDGRLYYADFDGGTIRRINGPTGGSTTRYLSDLPTTLATNGWGPMERDRSNGEQGATDGRPITLAGVVYPKGLGVHAASDVRFDLNGECSTFEAFVGVDDEVAANGSVVFQVFADGANVYDSGLMTGSTATRTASAAISGVDELRLVVTNGGDNINYDHADWADAKVTCGTTTTNQPPVAAIGATPTSGVAPLAVSFTAAGSTDPEAGALTYAWDLDDDGAFDDGTGLTRTFTYTAAGTYDATVRATDPGGLTDTASVTITVSPPTGGSTTRYLSDLPTTLATNGWGPMERDRSNGDDKANDGGPITLAGVVYPKGLGVHAASDVRFDLNGECSTFEAFVGVDDEVAANGSVVFQVFADGANVYDSGLMTGSTATRTASAAISGVDELRLVVTNGGDNINYDHADWADAKVTCGTNQPPVPVITAPVVTDWQVGTAISFAGGATDPENGALGAAALSWSLVIQHCPSNCHSHEIESWTGVATGSFDAPDHEYPSYLELILTATDSAGATASTTLRLDPDTVDLTFTSVPAGVTITVNGQVASPSTPITFIVGSRVSIAAPTQATISGAPWTFSSWSDGGAAVHDINAPPGSTTYTATYVPG